jgi:hypothetical protein
MVTFGKDRPLRMRARILAIGLGIALLLPLAVYTGVNIVSPPPDWDSFYGQNYDEQQKNATTKEEKQRIAQEEKHGKQGLDEQERRYQQRLFYVSFPVGVAAVILGAMLAVQSVGAGLMFGGIILLSGGCYSYWDKMTAVMRFLSVLVALAVFIALGYWKGRTAVGDAKEIAA